MMIANYHTHTWRCKHAEGTEREYIESAIAAGMQTLGFSDHAPYPFPGDYVSYFRMLPSQAEDYFTTLSALKQEYAGEITLHLGVEAEYYPRFFPDLMDLLSQFPCEYMILGQHYTLNEIDGVYSGRATGDEAVLKQYTDQVVEGLETGKFTYAAHPDLLYWQGDPAPYRRECLRLCQRAKALDIPLELNFGGMADHRHYPGEAFWRIAGEVGNDAVLGCDAHAPEELQRPELERRCRAIAKKFGLRVLETVELRPCKE